MNLPKARVNDIVVQELGKELLIYDLITNKAFSLNETSKIIYQSCDGETSFDELKRKHRELNDDMILLGVNELSQTNMLTQKFESGINRRTLLQKAAISAMALPIIISLATPAAAQSQSCLAQNQLCNLNDPGQCCSKVCINDDPDPVCGAPVCVQAGQPCDLGNPGACCSKVCFNGSPPYCG